MSKEDLINKLIYTIYTSPKITRIKVFISSNYPLFSAYEAIIFQNEYRLYNTDNPLIWVDSE